MKISKPTSVTRTGYAAVPGAQSELPTEVEWKRTTNGGNSSDSILNGIYRYLFRYHSRTGVDVSSGWDRLAILGELFFMSDHWLKRAQQAQKHDDYLWKKTGAVGGAVEPFIHRKATMERLYVTVVDKLCRAFDVTPNVLPTAIEECWGRALTKHGAAVDAQPDVARYLSRAEAENYRLRFDNGKVLMRSRTKLNKVEPANSAVIGWKYAPQIKEQMMDAGYAGFALSIGRDLYMAHHRGGFNKDNFFHSSYMAGDAVLCTGTILIIHGEVKAIRNDSGHYQPSLEHLMNVLHTLVMRGVDVKTVLVRAVPHSWRWNGVVQTTELKMWGADLLQQMPAGGAVHQRMEANKRNLANRGGAPASQLRRLPTPPLKT